MTIKSTYAIVSIREQIIFYGSSHYTNINYFIHALLQNYLPSNFSYHIFAS